MGFREKMISAINIKETTDAVELSRSNHKKILRSRENGGSAIQNTIVS
jgi:hypothetical protein